MNPCTRSASCIDHPIIGGPYAGGILRELSAAGDVLRSGNGDAVSCVQACAGPSRMPARRPPGARRKCGWFAAHRLDLATEAACPQVA